MKKEKIIFWITTGLLGLFILPGAFFMNSEMAIQGAQHLGVPEWLRWEVSIGTLLAGLILVIPKLPRRLKEWNYVALGIVYVSALIAHLTVDGFVFASFMPVITFGLLVTSYVYYHKLHRA
jgi:hypothetical protein